ncbi:metallo-beta-lactamase family protein [Caloramator quimbayensis]|uniref:Metallo-beta-lactamase family protein n=1 Tax=Caloramator quimbayensis TaxID=1147123 RepID=A0A1T4XSX9_9CLOT|nr:MBL fold metallo-hydrolase [Caloramator quimbayensis]SKA92647.1 metallo-beta-lactamase family protein [Caloramator quimbayensis]
MKIKFCGAARTVTGSCCYIETCKRKFLIDCGMFQGNKEELNKEDFPFNPKELDFIILTHAHIDHSGRIPLLIKKGFKGSIYCTSATSELVNIMLKDSAHIQEKEALWDNKKRLRKGLETVEPLYKMEDAELVNEYLFPLSYEKIERIDENISFILKDAGHLLGSCLVVLKIKENGRIKTITFTGDLGNFNIPIIRDYEYIDETDYLIIESTYGNRIHEAEKESEDLYNIIIDTIERGGNVIIPSFAVGRTQEVLYLLNYYIDIEKRKRLKNIEIYLDSPLGIQATEIFEKHKECYDEEALRLLNNDIDPINFDNLNIIKTSEESMALNEKKGVVIISSSGMCEAGRIKHHLKHNIWREESSIVFVGYQAEGTLGRKILDGAKEVSIFGEKMVVKAKIHSIQGLSGHADVNGILNWVKNIKNGVRESIFIIHGEPEAQESLKDKLKVISNADILIPDMFDEYNI